MKPFRTQVIRMAALLSLTSCYSYVQVSSPLEYETYQQMHKVYILELKTKADSIVRFSDLRPGILENGEAVGYKHVLMQDLRPDSTVYTSRRAKTNYAVKDGVRYWISKPDKEKRIICVAQDLMHIPFSEISQMQIKQFEPVKSAFVSLGIAAAGTAFTMAIGLLIIWISYL